MTVHEVATDPAANLVYVSHYALGMRALRYTSTGMKEVRAFEHREHALLVRAGRLADRIGVVCVGQVPVLDVRAARSVVERAHLVLLGTAGRDEQDGLACLADAVLERGALPVAGQDLHGLEH